jgi:hypothetical protein
VSARAGLGHMHLSRGRQWAYQVRADAELPHAFRSTRHECMTSCDRRASILMLEFGGWSLDGAERWKERAVDLEKAWTGRSTSILAVGHHYSFNTSDCQRTRGTCHRFLLTTTTLSEDHPGFDSVRHSTTKYQRTDSQRYRYPASLHSGASHVTRVDMYTYTPHT